MPQIAAAVALGSPCAHIVTALLDVGIEVTPRQLSNVIARLRRQREDAPGLPEAGPALDATTGLRVGAGIPEGPATAAPVPRIASWVATMFVSGLATNMMAGGEESKVA